MTVRVWLLALVWALSSTSAQAARFALLIGQNRGHGPDPLLRYAEDDAARVRDAMVRYGDVAAENAVLLLDTDADGARRALIALNERIRRTSTRDDVLLVYYSGHADADALHLGGSSLPLAEFESLVVGSAAGFRVLVVDACRSGALTRVKGGRTVAPFAIALNDRQAAEGVVVLTAAAATEDAQESDALRGSFFTHHFVSGLLGAADENGDGRVGLQEVYRHAYANTLRASSRTLAGVQHPTFRYDMSGMGDLMLTSFRAGTNSALLFPAGATDWLVMRNTDGGDVVLEVPAGSSGRRVVVPAGRYFVRGRAVDALLEGTIDVASNSTAVVVEQALSRTAYARLARKGGGEAMLVPGVGLGYTGHGSLVAGTSSCQGAFVEATFDTHWLTLSPRLSGCRAGFKNAFVIDVDDELLLDVRGSAALDLPLVTVSLGALVGGGVLHQTFTTARTAPPLTTGFGALGLFAEAGIDLPAGFSIVVDGEVRSYAFRAVRDGETTIATPIVGAWSAGLRKHF